MIFYKCTMRIATFNFDKSSYQINLLSISTNGICKNWPRTWARLASTVVLSWLYSVHPSLNLEFNYIHFEKLLHVSVHFTWSNRKKRLILYEKLRIETISEWLKNIFCEGSKTSVLGRCWAIIIGFCRKCRLEGN